MSGRIWTVEPVVLVERYLGGLDRVRLSQVAQESARATASLPGIAYLGSTAIPGDETCLCLFRAAGLEAVAELNGRVSAPTLRVVQALIARA